MTHAADSGGVPWAGRDLPAGPFAGDDGRADPQLAAALAGPDSAAPGSTKSAAESAGGAARGGAAPAELAVAVCQALGPARVFVAVVAWPGPTTDLALVTLERADGRRSLPVFSSADALAAWRPDARPVPVVGRQAALSAVADGCDLLHVDPGLSTEHLVLRPALWAVAQDRPWQPAYLNPVVTQEVSRLLAATGLVGRCAPGDPAELRVIVSLPLGLAPPEVRATTERLADAFGRSDVMGQDVDSVEIVVVPD